MAIAAEKIFQSLEASDGDLKEEFKVELTLENIFEFLDLSLKVENESLKLNVKEFIGEHGRQIMSSESFKNLSTNALKEILLMDEDMAGVSEVELFEWVMQWSEHQCLLNKDKVNPINKRRVLGDLIKLIRFTAMTLKQFTECTKKYDGILSSDEKSSLLIGIKTNKPNENELGFFKPRKVFRLNSNQWKLKKITVSGDFIDHWTCQITKCPKTRSRFRVSELIYVTNVFLAEPKYKQKLKMIIGIDDTILHEQEQMAFANNLNIFTLKRPIKLLPDLVYYIDVKYDNPNALFACDEPKICPFNLAHENFFYYSNNAVFNFREWSPLLYSVYFKQRRNQDKI